jgi:hypothetical protein
LGDSWEVASEDVEYLRTYWNGGQSD